MRERPILFSTPMVRAILEGRKTMTRRAVKFPIKCQETGRDLSGRDLKHELARRPELCRHGQPGDRLWVKETFFAWGRWETRYSANKRRDEWHFIDAIAECGTRYAYAADYYTSIALATRKRNGGVVPRYWKRPAIFMPRTVSRITLEVTGVRVERLQQISYEDAKAEGIETGAIKDPTYFTIQAFRDVWQAINGVGSWAANPWVWVIEFKRVTS